MPVMRRRKEGHMRLLIKLPCLMFIVLLLGGFTQPLDNLQTITYVGWNPTGEQIVTGHRGLIAFWDVPSGEQVTTIDIMNPYAPTQPLGVKAVAWHPDGSKLAVGTSQMDPIGLILILDSQTGEVLGTLSNQNGVPDLDWSPDGKRLVSAAPELFGFPGEDAAIVWDTETYTEVGRIDGELLEGVSTVDWHPTENWVATGGGLDDNAYVWDVDTGEMLTTLSGYQGFVNVVTWHPDGSTIATGSDDGTLGLWTSSVGQLLNSFNLSDRAIRDADWSPDGDKLAFVGLQQGYIIDMTTSAASEAFDGREIITWNPDGSALATLGNNGADADSVAIYDAAGNLISTIIPGESD